MDFTGGVCESINLKDGGYGQDGEKRLGLFKSMERATREKSLISASIRVITITFQFTFISVLSRYFSPDIFFNGNRNVDHLQCSKRT